MKKSVKEVVREEWFVRSNKFNVYKFCDYVKRVLKARYSKYASEGSILRRMRELRAEGLINYEIVNKTKGTYRKLEL